MFVPQIVGGLLPVLVFTLKKSVIHLVADVAGVPVPAFTMVVRSPFSLVPSVVVAVEGPVMAKATKSSLIYKEVLV